MAVKIKKEIHKPLIFYFHGFASGPKSEKAKYFQRKFKMFGYNVHIPDLNQPDFENLHFDAMVNFARNEILAARSDKIILIGSSLGALVALALSAALEHVKAQILIAPAVTFPDSLTDLLGVEKLNQWKENGTAVFYHHQANKELSLSYSFVESFKHFSAHNVISSVPTQIFHGAFDDRIPFLKVENFAKSMPNCEFHLLEADHGMLNKLDWMWREIIRFLEREILVNTQEG